MKLALAARLRTRKATGQNQMKFQLFPDVLGGPLYGTNPFTILRLACV